MLLSRVFVDQYIGLLSFACSLCCSLCSFVVQRGWRGHAFLWLGPVSCGKQHFALMECVVAVEADCTLGLLHAALCARGSACWTLSQPVLTV